MKLLRNQSKKLSIYILLPLFVVLTSIFFVPVSKVYAATTRIDLGTADSFAVLAGSSINDTNISAITGNVGLSPSAWLSALTCIEVTGTIYSVDATGPLPCRVTNPGLLTQAKNDLTTAYTNASNSIPVTNLSGADNQLGGKILTDGIYSFGSASSANLTGALTLDAQGNPDAVFILQASSTLVTASGSSVNLINGAQACNVFWQVSSSATFGTGSNFAGTVMADQSITDNGGSIVNGRFLARIAAVTLNNTNITKPTCATTTAGSNGSSNLSASFASSSSCPALPTSIVSPNLIESRRIDSDSIFLSWGPYSGTDSFNVRFGPTNGNWLYNTDVRGFSTTINALPLNQPMWFQIAARNTCSIGIYGNPVLLGRASLPNTGVVPDKYTSWEPLLGILSSLIILYIGTKKWKPRKQ